MALKMGGFITKMAPGMEELIEVDAPPAKIEFEVDRKLYSQVVELCKIRGVSMRQFMISAVADKIDRIGVEQR